MPEPLPSSFITVRASTRPRPEQSMPATTRHMAARIFPVMRARGFTETMSSSTSLELFSCTTARTMKEVEKETSMKIRME